MYKVKLSHHRTKLHVNNSSEGETIEQKIDRILNNNEPIEDGAPLLYTEKGDGVNEKYDIRTDKHELMIEAQNKLTRTELTKDVTLKREAAEAKRKAEADTDKNNGGSQET